MKYDELIKDKSYNFLNTNPHLKNRLMLLGYGGSKAYGTNTSTSDTDIRGISLNSVEELIGLKEYEQFEDENTDTVIYSFNKIISLLINCNPNVIEMLGLREEDYIFKTPLGEDLIDKREMFLSKKAYYTFSGYANTQLRRLQNAIARDRVSNKQKQEHIVNSLNVAMNHFNEKYTNFDTKSFRVYKNDNDEIVTDINITGYPLRELNGVLSETIFIAKNMDSVNNRNHKKDKKHLNKHCMHLIRLYMMAYDILKNKEIITYRKDEHNLLMDIRNGKYMNEDYTISQEFFDILNYYEKKTLDAFNNTTLSDKPNIKQIEDFVIKVNKSVISNF